MSNVLAKNKNATDMTSGNILLHLIRFSLPLLLGNAFQLLYNMVDTWVVGNYVSDSAFAAVGTVGAYINLLVGFFMGFSNGASVVISQYFGAKKEAAVKEAVHTSFILTIVLGVIFTFLGIVTVPFVLKQIMNFPDDVYPEARSYLIIYFSGLLGLMIYNIGSGILRAVGDSKRPFYFLVISALLNIALDLLFVLFFRMGVEGVAYATIISQWVSAILVVILLMKTNSCIKLSLKNIRVNNTMLLKILKIGFPSAIQLAVTAFSNMFVYSYINHFGKAFMGGYTAYTKIDQIVMLPIQSLNIAITTFVGQNFGSDNIARAKNGVKNCIFLGLAVTVVIIIPVIAFSSNLVSLFNSNETIVQYGSLLLKVVTPFYVLCCISNVYSGALRGAGNTLTPMIIMLSTFVAFRQVYLYVMSNFISNTEIAIVMAFPAGWFLCALFTLIYYYKVGLKKKT